MTFRKALKSLLFALWTALALCGPAMAAGTIPLAMAQQIDINGQPLAGCILSFFVAGTPASPQNSYSDFGLSLNPLAQLTCDQSGRIPMFWLADGLIHVRLTDSSGVQIIDTTMQVLGPSSGGGGGGGGTVDPTTVLSSGDLKVKYGTGPLTGFVRANGLTIGSAISGATERANADTQTLYIYLYGADPNLVVSGGRTGNALADFNANKTIALPDWRGRALAALDDMGNTAAGRLTASYFGSVATTLGASGGGQNATLITANLPPYTPGGLLSVTSTQTNVVQGTIQTFLQGVAASFQMATGATASAITSTGFLNGTPQGGASAPVTTVMPAMLATIYVKL